MSPEQALGKPVDARSDLFSFGILLYEMCTGRSPFPGDTTGELLISIVQHVQLTPAQLNPDIPQGLARIIDRCLQKDRNLRYQHASEIRADLKEVQRNPLAEIATPSLPAGITSSGPASSGSRTFAGAASGGASSASATTESKPLHAIRRRWLLAFSGLLIVAAVLLAFFLTAPLPVPKAANYVQLTHDGQPKALVGTDGSRLYLGFARTINYSATTGIMQMSASGGEPIRITAASTAVLPLNVSQDGSEILVKDNQGTDYRGELLETPHPRRVAPPIGRYCRTGRGLVSRWQEPGLRRRKRIVSGQE